MHLQFMPHHVKQFFNELYNPFSMIASKIYWLKQRITKLISHLTKWHLYQSNVTNEEEKNINTEIHLKAYNYFVIFFFNFSIHI